MVARPCVGDMHTQGGNGLGNQLYAAMAVWLYATTFDRCLVIVSPVIRLGFNLPSYALESYPTSYPVVDMPERLSRKALAQEFKNGRVHLRTRWWFHKENVKSFILKRHNVTNVQEAMRLAAKSLFSLRSNALRHHMGSIQTWPTTAVHLRTSSDSYCKLEHMDGVGDCGQCVPKHVAHCVWNMSIGKTVLMSDSPALVNRLQRAGYLTERDMLGHASSTKRSTTQEDPQKLLDTLSLWWVLKSVKWAIGTPTSTFSKSAFLSAKTLEHRFLMDMRCTKSYASDSDLYTCQQASVQALV